MKTLIVGAGGIGGYFGGRMLAAGRDATFLVRPRRAGQLAARGLNIKSMHGDVHVPSPPTVQADALREHYDLVLLSCKAYDLDDAMKSFAPAVGPETVIVPMLNGMRQLDALDERFGAAAVMGGLCFIASTLNEDGDIVHLNPNQLMVFGERDGSRSVRAEAIAAEMAGCSFDSRLSETIIQEMWEKWMFIGTGAGITCLMRASVGDIEAAGGAPIANALIDECAEVARLAGHAPSEKSIAHARKTFTERGSTLTASMYRDIIGGGRTECEHLLGDLLRRGKRATSTDSILRLAYANVAAYEAGRVAREAAKG